MRIIIVNSHNFCALPCADPEGEQGSGPTLKNQKNIRVLGNTSPDLLKNHKATSLSHHSMLGHHRHAGDNGPRIVVFAIN